MKSFSLKGVITIQHDQDTLTITVVPEDKAPIPKKAKALIKPNVKRCRCCNEVKEDVYYGYCQGCRDKPEEPSTTHRASNNPTGKPKTSVGNKFPKNAESFKKEKEKIPEFKTTVDGRRRWSELPDEIFLRRAQTIIKDKGIVSRTDLAKKDGGLYQTLSKRELIDKVGLKEGLKQPWLYKLLPSKHWCKGCISRHVPYEKGCTHPCHYTPEGKKALAERNNEVNP